MFELEKVIPKQSRVYWMRKKSDSKSKSEKHTFNGFVMIALRVRFVQ